MRSLLMVLLVCVSACTGSVFDSDDVRSSRTVQLWTDVGLDSITVSDSGYVHFYPKAGDELYTVNLWTLSEYRREASLSLGAGLRDHVEPSWLSFVRPEDEYTPMYVWWRCKGEGHENRLRRQPESRVYGETNVYLRGLLRMKSGNHYLPLPREVFRRCWGQVDDTAVELPTAVAFARNYVRGVREGWDYYAQVRTNKCHGPIKLTLTHQDGSDPSGYLVDADGMLVRSLTKTMCEHGGDRRVYFRVYAARDKDAWNDALSFELTVEEGLVRILPRNRFFVIYVTDKDK